MIRISPIRVIGPDNEQIGVIETVDALRMADEQGYDLVEVVSDARPPVCKIMDHGKFKYEQSKKQKSGSAGKATEMKEIRLGRSVKIDPHDVGIRIDRARKFLMAGHKVQVTQRFRGREIAHKELGLNHLRKVADELESISKVEQSPRWMGRQASIVLAPDKPKIEAVKARLAREQAANKGQDEAKQPKEKAKPKPKPKPQAAPEPAAEIAELQAGIGQDEATTQPNPATTEPQAAPQSSEETAESQAN